jgi:hypothetical protein
MDDYNFLGGHTYYGSPLGGLHTYNLTISRVLPTLRRGGTTYIKTHI